MAKAQLNLSAELERGFADAQNGRVRFVKISIVGEDFVLAGAGAASSDPRRDCETLAQPPQYLAANEAAFVLFCLDVHVPALRWVLLAFVPEGVSVRDKMLYSSSRESLKKQLGLNYFVGEFHATELSEVTFDGFQNAKKRHAVDAPLSETERMLKEASLLERDTNVRSTAMGVIPFGISDNVRTKLTLLKDGKFDWIAMRLNTDSESVEVAKSLETVELMDVQSAIDPKTPSFIAYRYRASLLAAAASTGATSSLLFVYVCPEDAPVRLKMVYSTAKATILAMTSSLGIEFDKTIEINTPATAVEEIRAELMPTKVDDDVTKAREFSRPAAPGRGRGRGPTRRGAPMPSS